jgi:hypothetical protein
VPLCCCCCWDIAVVGWMESCGLSSFSGGVHHDSPAGMQGSAFKKTRPDATPVSPHNSR